MSAAEALPSAEAITDWVWCVADKVPHALGYDGEIDLVGEDVEGMDCLLPFVKTITGNLPEDWEKDWIAFQDTYGGSYYQSAVEAGYTLYPKSIKPTGDHRRMYFLEEPLA